MMFAVQVDSGIRGYVRDKADKERKQKEKILIKGKGEAEFTVISREKLPDVNLINANFIVTSEPL